MDEKLIKKGHTMRMTDRASCQLTGIKDVIALDESEALLDTEMGVLSIRGKGLHMSRLTLEKGEADMDGTFQGFVYSDNGSHQKKGESFLKRIFR